MAAGFRILAATISCAFFTTGSTSSDGGLCGIDATGGSAGGGALSATGSLRAFSVCDGNVFVTVVVSPSLDLVLTATLLTCVSFFLFAVRVGRYTAGASFNGAPALSGQPYRAQYSAVVRGRSELQPATHATKHAHKTPE